MDNTEKLDITDVKNDKQMHCVFRNNPIELKNFVHKYVEVKTVNGETHEGTVYTIDPVSESVILVKQNDGITSMYIVMGHAVKTIDVKPDTSTNVCKELFPAPSKELSEEEAALRRGELKEWLCTNRVPIEEHGKVLKLEEVLEIHPPYGVDQCLSGNEIILSRVQHLISTMPSG